MCGIAGIFAYGASAPPVDQEELLRVREAMIRRGPDGSGLWISADRRAGLAHRRLSIIDVGETGAQPMATADGRLRITFNGEIYNYRDLRRGLEAKGFVFQSNSDTEVLLHLYADRGPDMVNALRGMFAFGIWDARDHTLFLARDGFGIKPLYYSDADGVVRFASQVKALLAGGAIVEEIEPAGYAGYFLWGSVPEPYTLYRGVRALPAGHWLLVGGRSGRDPYPFYCLRTVFLEAEASAGRISAPRRLDAIREAFEDSVERHLVADVPVGAFLSAGLDSAMLSASAARHGPLRSLTLGFDEYRGTRSDETTLAAMTANAVGSGHEERWIGYAQFHREIRSVLEAMDQPSIDGLNTYFIAAAARESGMKVALSGLGGDELFAGYPSFQQVPRMANLVAAIPMRPGLARALRRVSGPVLRSITSPKYAGIAEYGRTLAGAYLLRRALFMPWELPRLLDPDIAAAGLTELATLDRLEQSIAGIGSPRLALSCLEMSWYMKNQLLRDADWAGMAHSLEVRVPFVDTALLARVAPLLVHSGAPSKSDVARSVFPAIPPAVLDRPKTGFTVPVRAWLARTEGKRGARGMRGWAQRVFAGVRRDRRVLLLATDLYGRTGGIAQFNRDLVNALCLDSRTVRLDILVRNRGAVPSNLPAKVHLHRNSGKSVLAYLAAIFVPTLCRPAHCELIVCGHLNLLPFAWLAKYLKGGNLLLVLHGVEAWRPARKWAAKLSMQSADAIAGVSKVTFDRFDRWAPQTGAKRFLLPDCIDLDRFTPGPSDPEIVRRHGLQGARTLFTMGRFDAGERYKGVDEILCVLHEVLREVPNLIYLIAGAGNDLPRLRAKAVALGLEPHTRFAGFVAEEEKVSYYRTVDAFALPGRGEGFGIVYLEAAACGLPTIGSVLDASREALLDGRLGQVVNPDDSRALTEAILRALKMGKTFPDGIEHFSFPEFSKRCAGMVDQLSEQQLAGP